MKLWVKFLLIMLIVGIPAFVLGPIIWPPSPDIRPTHQQIPFFMFLSIIESLFFGFGIAFIIFGWPLVKKASAQSKNITIGATV